MYYLSNKLLLVASNLILWYYNKNVLEVYRVMKTPVNESAENYLETILVLSQRLPVVRSVDIANELEFKKSSVSIAMKNLREKNQIVVSDAGYITLTDEGKKIAETIYERHQFFSTALMNLGVDEETAAEDACRIEHVISAESFAAIKKYCYDHGIMQE